MLEQLEVLRRVADRIESGNEDTRLYDIINHLLSEIEVTKNLWRTT